MEKFDKYYLVVFSVLLLLVILILMQYREFPDYFVVTVVYLVTSYTLLFKFESSSRLSKVILCFSLLISVIIFLLYGI